MKKQISLRITKGDKTRRRILETTSVMMAERGPDSVSMREISDKLKITKPVLYYYFKDKDELIKAAFVEGIKHFRELHFETSRPGLTLEQKLEKIFRNHLKFIRRYPEMPKCALKIMASPSDGVLSQMARDLKQNNISALRGMMEASAHSEGLSKTGIDGIIHMVSAVITYFMIEAREHGAASLDRNLPSRFARLICAGARSLKVVAAAALLSSSLAGTARAGTPDPLNSFGRETEVKNSAITPIDDSRQQKGLGLSLNAAVETALKNNAAVVTAEETRHIYKEKVTEYWGTVYPQLSANGQYTRNIESPSFFIGGKKMKSGLNNVYTAGLNLDQVLWAGGKVNTGIRMADIYSLSSDEQLKTARKGVSKAVKQVYYSVLLAKSLAGIQKESLDLANQHLATIDAQYKQGIASDLAVLRQKVEVSNTAPALTQAQNLYEEGLIELKNLLGLDPETDISLSDDFNCGTRGPGEIAALYKAALLNRPEYRNVRYQRDLYREMITIERAGHFPYLSAFASRQFQGQSDSGLPDSGQQSWSTTAGVKLSLPLFAGGSVNSRTRQAELQAGIAETNLKELERRIKIEVKKAWLSMAEASERLASQAASVEQARKAMTATEIRFKNGLASQLELNDTSLALNRSQTLYIQALHDTCSADAELKWTLGE